MLSDCGVGEDSWEFLGLRGDQTSQSQRKSTLYIHWKDWCWNWHSNTLSTTYEEQTHWKRPWCWERLKAKGEGVAYDEMVGWHHRLNEHEFEQILGGEEDRGARQATVRGVAELNMTQWLNSNKRYFTNWQHFRVDATSPTLITSSLYLLGKLTSSFSVKLTNHLPFVTSKCHLLNLVPTGKLILTLPCLFVPSVVQLCLNLCNPVNCSTPGFPVLHHLLDFAQTHVHWVSDVI